MKKLSLRILPTLALGSLLAGCVVAPVPVVTRPSHPLPITSGPESCPPGHRWSDGRCHEEGKGHDPAKHEGKHEDRGDHDEGHGHHGDHGKHKGEHKD